MAVNYRDNYEPPVTSESFCESNEAEIGRDLCRVEVFLREERKKKERGGYKKDILTENLTVREKAVLICITCEGIMKEACISSSGQQLCSCCEDQFPSKQTPNLLVRKMINSLNCSCPLIERGCKWLGNLENCENHLDTCDYVTETCKLTCGAVLIRQELKIHVKDKCPLRVVKCNHCNKRFKSCELNEHFKKCPKMKVPCDLCGRVTNREDMEQHIKFTCDMVRETCKLGCGVKLTRNELLIHVSDNCVQREIQCDYCYINVIFRDSSEHLIKCPKVKVTCDICGVMVSREDMREHLEEYCPEKILDCPFVKYKCMLRIKRKDINIHLEENEIKHLGLKLTAMEDLIAKQSKDINKQNEDNQKQNKEIDKLNENIEKQHKEITNTSQQIELLYFITDTTKITWTINIFDMYFTPSESEQYEVAGFSFRFKYYLIGGELSIVFPGTTFKCDRPFIAKCHIIPCVNTNILNGGIIEVKQKYLARGCERTIASITNEYTRIYPQNYLESILTLEIYITMQ